MMTIHGKRELYALLALVVVTALVALVWATPATAQMYDQAVSAESGYNYLRYYGSVDMEDDPDTTYYTQAFVVGESKYAPVSDSLHSWIRVVCDGGSAEDVDVKLQTQAYPGTWDTATEIKNAQGATATLDTLSVINGAAPTGWHHAIEARLQFVPDAANDADYCQWVITMPKDPRATLRASSLKRDDQ